MNLEEIKKSEKYKYFIELGYSEKEAFVLSVIDLNQYTSQLYRIIKGFKEQKEQSFIDYVYDHYFDKVEKSEEEDDDIFDSAYESSSKGAVRKTVAKEKNIFARGFDGLRRAVSRVDPSSKVWEERGLYLMSNGEARPAEFRAQKAASPNLIMSAAQKAPLAPEIPEMDKEQLRTDSYDDISETEKRNTVNSPTATFRPTYNTASVGNILGDIRKGLKVQHSAVRIEELLNYLSYNLNSSADKKFEVTKELKTVEDKTYLFLGVQGEKVVPSKQNICLLLDVSGSMSSKKDVMIETIATILSKMNPNDILSLVTYSTNDTVVINGLKLDEKKNLDDIFELLSQITISGCTNGSAGINKAFEIVESNLIEDGVNRIILMTDGDLNFGTYDNDGLKELIGKHRDSGAYFSAIGMGTYNLMDDKLEILAKNGNGNYFVVNDISDVRKSILKKYESLVFPIAKNVKAQIEFNPKVVSTWKLIGYENRMLNHEDFKNDEVIAEPFGSGSYFIALFEIEMNKDGKVESDLKYQTIETTKSDEIGTLKIRFEEGKEFKELEFIVEQDLPATENIDKAIKCAELAEKLRDTENVDELTRSQVQKLFEND